MQEIDEFCENGIKWFASAWDQNSLKFLDQLIEFHKIASAMMLINFLNAVAERGKYTFISTGMSEKTN